MSSIQELLERKLEDSVIDIFTKRAEKLARKSSRQFISSPLNGQDRELGADLFLTNRTRFLLIEFKYREAQIIKESEKPLRLELCKGLAKDSKREKQHRACHFIAWSTSGEQPHVVLNHYCDEVCNNDIWSDGSLTQEAPKVASRVEDVTYIERVLSGKVGLLFTSFSSYVAWLMGLAGNQSGRFELLIEHPDDDVIESRSFASLNSLKAWLDANPPAPTPRTPSTPSP